MPENNPPSNKRMTDDDVALLAAQVKTGEVIMTRDQIEARYRRAELTLAQQTELIIALQIAQARPLLSAEKLVELETLLRSLPALKPELAGRVD